MHFEPTRIDGLWAIRLQRFEDERGSFARIYSREDFLAQGLPEAFVQASLSVTRTAGSVRGMHFQRPPHGEVKMVRCVRGAIHDVIVDLRRTSPTFMVWQAFELAAAGGLGLCIPEGCAHGFQTLTDDCEVLYHMNTGFAPTHADGVRFDDPAIGIEWPRPVTVVSAKDRAWPLIATA